MFLFLQLVLEYIIETSSGDLYNLENGYASFILNINEIDESNITQHLNPPNQLAFIEDKKSNVIITPSKQKIVLEKKYTNVFIDKKGRIIFVNDNSRFVLPYTIYDVLKEPRVLGSVALYACKDIKLHFITNVGIFVITITLYVREYENEKKHIYKYFFTPFYSTEQKVVVNENIDIDDVVFSCDDINGEVVCIYGIRKVKNNSYFEIIYRKRDILELIWREEKITHVYNSKYLILFMFLLIIFILYFKRHKSRIRIGTLVRNQDYYEIKNEYFDNNPLLLKIYKLRDIRIEREILVLRKAQRHNVIKFYCKERFKRFLCIVLEEAKPINRKLTKKEIFDIVTSLYDLQSKGITYNNLCMDNIFINSHNEVVIINFENSEILIDTSNSTSTNKANNDSSLSASDPQNKKDFKGYKGWRSPECITHEQGLIDLTPEILLKVDSFSVGILLYYNEMHKTPFEHNTEEIEDNILTGNYILEYLSNHSLHDLICHCLAPTHSKRISIPEIYNHPYFWSSEKGFNFIAAISDFIENKSNESSRMFLRLERNKSKLFTNKWTNYIDPIIEEELMIFRLYNEKNCKGLLRAIRNKGRHFKELPDEIKKIYGTFPNGFMDYYTSRFSSLLMVCFYSAKCSKDDDMLKEFYGI